MAKATQKTQMRLYKYLAGLVVVVAAILLAGYNGQKIKKITFGMLGIEYDDSSCSTSGIKIEGISNVKIENNEISGFDCGIDAQGIKLYQKITI